MQKEVPVTLTNSKMEMLGGTGRGWWVVGREVGR